MRYLWPFLLLLVSILLLITETFVPSAGILGILSGLALVCAIVAAYMNIGPAGGTLFLLACMALAPVVFSLLVRYWPKTPIGRRILIKPPTEDEVRPLHQQSLKALVGRTGTAISTMLPGGAVRIEGKVIDAVSEGMSIERGTPVEVIAVQGNHVVVRPITGQDKEPATTQPSATDILSQPVDSIVSDPFQDPLA
jgi:membrane-bound ClpP family serine protease